MINNITLVNFKDTCFDLSFLKDVITENDDLFPDPFSKHVDISLYVDKLFNFGEILVAVENDNIVGVACAYMNNMELKTFFLQMIFVDRFHQHKGIARLLLEKLFEISKEHGMHYGRLTVDRSNVNAQKLYEKMGFFDSKEIHENPNKKYMDVNLV